jgi:hypothetical protein
MKSEKPKVSSKVIVRRCILADREHDISTRQYAHVHHVDGRVICVAGSWITLPLETEMGLIAHEVGHLIAGKNHKEHSEAEADKVANKFFKITILYRDTTYGNRLQYLTHRDTMKVYEWVIDNVKFEGKLFA